MATSNRDRIGQMFELLAPALDEFISTAIGGSGAPAANWVDLVRARDEAKGIVSKVYDPLDPQVQLRMLTEPSITKVAKPGWYPFDERLGKVGESFASELRDARNRHAHNASFSDDDAYRILDTGERLLRLINAADEADKVKAVRLNLRRVTAERDDKRTLKRAAADNPDSGGLQPWREVLPPHEDVRAGRFQAAEFAADLYKVATSPGDQEKDYAEPVEFFRRTYLTEGLRELIGRTARRLSGDDNASPVTNLQTNFGGGKTHSMLSLWHLAGGTPISDYPQELQELLHVNGFTASGKIHRVAIVGNHFSPSGETKPDGTRVNTMWGELAWQLGRADGYALVAEADRNSTPPGKALHTLLARYSPAVILIDEWVAYARSLVGRDDLPGGSFDDQFTFAQALTEAARGTSGVMLAISIPASETGEATGNEEEVGGTNGVEALRRLQNVVRRIADQWHPASSTEAYHIVRQRLFVSPDAEALAAIRETAKAFAEMYRKHTSDFPRDARETSYEDRIKRTYPIHPELFDRLYEDWSSLERFQRTRGVLRLMNTVIHALWVGEDASPLILPGSIPLRASDVNSELTGYLQDSWKAIIDADVDGENSEPAKIDATYGLLGGRHLTKRLARAVFFGAAPTIGSAHKGIETQRAFLGTAVPGDVPGNFHSALNHLGDRATYFYSGQGKLWYDTRANITRTAKDQAERLPVEEVWAEITRRLEPARRIPGNFVRVHSCPEETSDIPDVDEARLVVVHPKHTHKRNEPKSSAMDFARRAIENKGSSHREYRNMVVFLAADIDRLKELEGAVRDYLGWKSVRDSTELDLTDSQRNQAKERVNTANNTVDSRLSGAYQWVLAPYAPDPGAPFEIKVAKVEGQTASLAERVSKRLGNDGSLYVQQSALNIRLRLDQFPKMWEPGHVRVGDLWDWYAKYAYMPRLKDQSVLTAGLVHQPLHWENEGFALAEQCDGERYVGLALPGEDLDSVPITNDTLLVKPERAKQQRDEEARGKPGSNGGDPRGLSGTGAATATDSGQQTGKTSDETSKAPAKTRFFGSKTLNPQRYAVDFKKIAEEILVHLADDDTELVVRIDIDAVNHNGFEERKIRTVSENADTLKFDQSGFEEQ